MKDSEIWHEASDEALEYLSRPKTQRTAEDLRGAFAKVMRIVRDRMREPITAESEEP